MIAPPWYDSPAARPQAKAWATAQLAAQIAGGIAMLQRSPNGTHTGLTSDSIAHAAVEIANQILKQVGLQ